jgi:hypothetical protein
MAWPSGFTDGYAASAPTLKRALTAVRDEDGRPGQDVRWPWFARRIAPDLFDDETWHALATRNVQIARDGGALALLPLALNYLATMRSFEGNLDAAEALLEESDAIAAAAGSARILFGRLLLARCRGDRSWRSIELRVEPASETRRTGDQRGRSCPRRRRPTTRSSRHATTPTGVDLSSTTLART